MFDAIADRGLRRDFVDLVVLLEHYPLTQLLDAYDRKYQALAANHLHLLKSLLYFNDAEVDTHPKILRDDLTWEHVKTRIEAAVMEYRAQ